MTRWTLAAVSFLAITVVAHADVMILPPGIDRIVLSDAIVVGRVIAIEPQDVEIPLTPDGNLKFRFRIAVVNVSEPIVGKKDVKTLRVGFVPADEKRNPIGFGKYPELNFRLELGKQGLMFLRKHAGTGILHGRLYHDFVAHDSEPKEKPQGGMPLSSFSEELKKSRQIARLMEKPVVGLQAKDGLDRYLSAVALTVRYRTPTVAKAKTELISSDESKLIFAALLERDWTIVAPTPTPWQCFQMLGITEREGWKSPTKIANANDLRAAVRTWHEKHGEYRISRFLPESAP